MTAYADPVAQAEVTRLRAENERLRAKVARLEALADEFNGNGSWVVAVHIRAVLRDPEETE